MLTDQKMPLRQHLNELRRSLIRCALLLGGLFVIGIVFDKQLLAFLWQPWNETRESITAAGLRDPGPLSFLGPAQGMMAAFRVSFLFALVCGAPYFLWELWRFVGVGLMPRERAAVWRAFFPGVALLLIGMYFGYTLLLPTTLEYLVTYIPPELAVSAVTVNDYLSFVIALTLVMGFVFETPLIMWAVARAGLVRAQTMGKSRRFAFLAILVFGAIVTPGTDVLSMLAVSGPMYVLYEVGLVLARQAERARERRDRARL
ncbi:MAG: twin-arginine translocase subunit TatC [Planctomycetota bacterium]